MSIKVNWTNPASAADSIRIYRSATPFDASNLPAALVTLAADAVEHIDTTNILNAVYYYRVGRVVGSDVVLSKQLALTERANMGPGSNVFIRGDADCGYMGDVTADDLFTTAGLSTELGISFGTVNAVSPTWHKFLHDGKIKFIPNNALRVHIGSWSTMYAAGLVYGSDDFGSNGGGANVLQNRRVSKGGNTYKVRLMKAHSKASPNMPSGFTPATVPDSEFAELITRMYQSPLLSGAARWNDRTKLLNEVIPPTYYCPMAGATGTNIYAMHSSTFAGLSSTYNSQIAWLPVLELVD
jgi:hypothetical protein